MPRLLRLLLGPLLLGPLLPGRWGDRWTACGPLRAHALPPSPPLAPTRPPPRSKPTITDAVSTASNVFTMTVNPVNSVPLVSYPAGGWAFYTITATANSVTESFTCT